MTEYVFPAVFHKNSDGSLTISFPDLPGCISEGKNIGNAIYMSQRALTQWINFLTEKKMAIPAPSELSNVTLEQNEFANYIRTEIREERAVRRTISLPKWMDDLAAENGLSLSRILQDAISARFNA